MQFLYVAEIMSHLQAMLLKLLLYVCFVLMPLSQTIWFL